MPLPSGLPKQQYAEMDTSIIVPAYNAAGYIEGLFDCLKHQVYQGFRIIFVDDGSNDSTLDEVQLWGKWLGSRLVVLQHEKQHGLPAARNTGLDWLQNNPTHFVTYLDADDWFEPQYLEDLRSRAIQTGAALTIAGIVRFNESTSSTLSREMVQCPPEVQRTSECATLAYINPCVYAKLFVFQGIEAIRFRTILRSEDTCYLFESLPFLETVAFTNNALYHYREHAESLTALAGKAQRESMHEHFMQLLPYFELSPYRPFKDMFQTQVFIRSAIGGVFRQVAQGQGSASQITADELQWLNSVMPDWKNNPYLSFGSAARLPRLAKPFQQFAIKMCASLYRAHVFVLFIGAYRLIRRATGREIRF